MKKQLGFVSVLAVTLGALVACGGSGPSGQQPGGGGPPAETLDAGSGGGGGGGTVVDAGQPAATDAGSIPSCELASGGQTGSKSCLLLVLGAQSCTSMTTPAEQCTCLQNKFKEGTSQAQGYALAMYNCAVGSTCGANMQCILQTCATEYAACRAN